MANIRLVRRPVLPQSDLVTLFCQLYIAARGLSTSAVHRAVGRSPQSSPNASSSAPPGTTARSQAKIADAASKLNEPATSQANLNAIQLTKMTPEALESDLKQRMQTLDAQEKQNQSKRPIMGGLALNSMFGDKALVSGQETEREEVEASSELSQRSSKQMSMVLDPRPVARARWQRKMVIRNIRHRGRMTREMKLARTERTHTAMSKNIMTSVKKLNPLARQIAGKSIDEAILQMRFSKKKPARFILQHLIQARNEAIVRKGMGIPEHTKLVKEPTKAEIDAAKAANAEAEVKYPEMGAEESVDGKKAKIAFSDLIERAVNHATPSTGLSGTSFSSAAPRPLINDSQPTDQPTQATVLDSRQTIEITEPQHARPLPTQQANRRLKRDVAPNPQDLYISQAWVNKSMYRPHANYRARGRVDLMRSPHTSISVMLKEERTRTREKTEKEVKALRKRLNNVWQGLPDRKVTRQSQQILW